eukprot:scaffold1973_cov92-Skeletonema_dohrnii-CCMP3373.AAC.7
MIAASSLLPLYITFLWLIAHFRQLCVRPPNKHARKNLGASILSVDSNQSLAIIAGSETPQEMTRHQLGARLGAAHPSMQ